MAKKWNNRLFMTREQIREYDRIAIEDLHIPGLVLMENAGQRAASIAASMIEKNNSVLIITGPGNNGGDGFVVARHMLNMGFNVTTCAAANVENLTGDALINYQILKEMNEPIVNLSTPESLRTVSQLLESTDLIVDGLLGTGVTRATEGHLAEVIKYINLCSTQILSLDMPSGLDANTGVPWGETVRAQETVTFGHIKKGMLQYPGAELCGKIHIVPIGVPGETSQKAGTDGQILDVDYVSSLLPPRGENAHKGTFGHLVVVAGSLGKSGAAVLASKAAMRVGTGLVTVATTAQAQPVIESRCMEVMVESVIEKTDAALTEKVLKKMSGVLGGKTAVALGPGLSTAPGISALVMRFLQMMEVPAVIDADGINILANDPSNAGRITTPMVFTPHPGEMARLLDKTVPEVQADRIEITRQAAKWHKVVIVLKGAHSVIAAPDGRVFINPTGNNGMASGGMGDILTGMIGGYLAQGLEPLHAAILGTYLHGAVGDITASELGGPGMVASDLIDRLPQLLKNWSC